MGLTHATTLKINKKLNKIKMHTPDGNLTSDLLNSPIRIHFPL